MLLGKLPVLRHRRAARPPRTMRVSAPLPATAGAGPARCAGAGGVAGGAQGAAAQPGIRPHARGCVRVLQPQPPLQCVVACCSRCVHGCSSSSHHVAVSNWTAAQRRPSLAAALSPATTSAPARRRGVGGGDGDGCGAALLGGRHPARGAARCLRPLSLWQRQRRQWQQRLQQRRRRWHQQHWSPAVCEALVPVHIQ